MTHVGRKTLKRHKNNGEVHCFSYDTLCGFTLYFIFVYIGVTVFKSGFKNFVLKKENYVFSFPDLVNLTFYLINIRKQNKIGKLF